MDLKIVMFPTVKWHSLFYIYNKWSPPVTTMIQKKIRKEANYKE